MKSSHLEFLFPSFPQLADVTRPPAYENADGLVFCDAECAEGYLDSNIIGINPIVVACPADIVFLVPPLVPLKLR